MIGRIVQARLEENPLTAVCRSKGKQIIMMRPRWRKVFHDLIGNFSRTALVVLSIAVGVFSIGVIVGAYVIISNDMSASYAANNPMNIELRTTPFGNELVTVVKNMRGIKQAEGRQVFTMRVRIPGSGQMDDAQYGGHQRLFPR